MVIAEIVFTKPNSSIYTKSEPAIAALSTFSGICMASLEAEFKGDDCPPSMPSSEFIARGMT